MNETILPFGGTKPKQGSAGGMPAQGGDPNTVRRHFPVGLVVWLKSGSAPMTVSHERSKTNDAAVVVVDWFDTEHFSHRSAFHYEQLTEVPTVWPSTVLLPSVSSSLIREGAETEPDQVEQTVQDTLRTPE